MRVFLICFQSCSDFNILRRFELFQKFNNVPPSNLLTTVSRIVSNSEISSTYKPEQPKPLKKKPKALHVTMWIHIFSLIVTIVLGWIDLLPASGPVSHLKKKTFTDSFLFVP